MLKKLLVLPGLLAACWVAMAKEKAGIHEVWSNTFNYGEPTALLTTLQGLMNQYPHVQRFNICWGMAEPHGANGGLLIYDQTLCVLWVYQDSSSSWPDDEESPDPIYHKSSSTQQWRFTQVTPNRLRLLFHKYGARNGKSKFSDTAYEVSFFPRLNEFGARGGLVGRTSGSWRERLVGGKWVRVR